MAEISFEIDVGMLIFDRLLAFRMSKKQEQLGAKQIVYISSLL
jgi:hypothetical protein